MTETPLRKSVLRYHGACKSCGKDLQRSIYITTDKNTGGLYVRCSKCNQINRCRR